MKATIISLIGLLIVAGCAEEPTSEDKSNEFSMVIFRSCECLRSSDPEVIFPAIDGLFKHGCLETYMLLHLKWIAEPNPQIRDHILLGFSRIGDHRYIADPDFPKGWVEASKRFASSEKERRMGEIKKYFSADLNLKRPSR